MVIRNRAPAKAKAGFRIRRGAPLLPLTALSSPAHHALTIPAVSAAHHAASVSAVTAAHHTAASLRPKAETAEVVALAVIVALLTAK
jgi:hypothetical protein